MTLEELYRLLRSDHVQTQGIVDTLQEPLVVLDKALCVVNANPAFYRTFHVDRESTVGQSLFELGDNQWDIPELRLLLVDVVPKAAAIIGFEVTRDFPDLGQRTMIVTARKLSHPDDNSTQMLVIFEDATERLRAVADQNILVAETRHRMKNLMAVVRAIATQTETEGRTAEEYRDTFMGRFESVLKAQDFISSNGRHADLAALIQQAVLPIAGDRAKVKPGPVVTLTEYQVQPVSMILHELATNALKYGALSSAGGTLHIEWSTEQRDGQHHLMLNWREEGGPPVSPPSHQGFGTNLIDYSSKADGGEAVLNFDPAGLHARIIFPVEQ